MPGAVGRIEFLDNLRSVGTHEEESRGLGGNPLAVSAIHSDIINLDTIEQIIGHAGAIVARHLDVVYPEAACEGLGGIERDDTLGTAHPHHAIAVLGEAHDFSPTEGLSILVDKFVEHHLLRP